MEKINKDTFIRRQIFLDDFADFPLRYGGWAISEDYAYDLVQYAMIHRPMIVLDLGTGTTTALLGKVAEELKKVGHKMKVISVDSDKEWLVDTKKILESMGVAEFVELVYAPIVETEKGKYYNPEKVFEAIGEKRIDLMTIDGPPGPTQKEARYPAMPLFGKFLSDKAVVLLDDGGREDEKAIVEKWKKEFPKWSFEYKPYMKGGFVIYKKEHHQISPIISNHSGIVDYDEDKKTISEDIGKIFNSIEKFQKQLETKDKELTQKNQQLETKDKELTQKIQQLETKDKELTQKNQQIETKDKELTQKKERIANLEASKSYRLGNLFFRSIRSPWKILTFPVNAMSILLEKKKCLNNKERRFNKEKHQTKNNNLDTNKYFLFNINEKIKKKEISEKILLDVEKNLSAEFHNSFEILKANFYKENEKKWLECLNNYLGSQGLLKISLKPKGEDNSLFDRFYVKDNYEVLDGSLVTIIMPAYNAEKTLKFAVESIINQTYRNWELIIVNDNSSDKTDEMIKDFCEKDDRIKFLENKINVGPYISKNRALLIAKGEYVTGHDADDWAHPQRIENQVNLLIKNKNKKVVLSRMLRLKYDGEFSIRKLSSSSLDSVMIMASISLFIDKNFLNNKLGFWDCAKCAADSELIERIKKIYPDVIVDQYLISMICLNNKNSLTNDKKIGADPIKGMSMPRQLYRKSYQEWHEQIKMKEEAFLSFPQTNRRFEIPKEIEVCNSKIKKINPINFLNETEFNYFKKIDKYWGDRWEYFQEVISIIKKESFNSVLELGPYKETIVKNADVMDKDSYMKNTKYNWDATKTPWPIEDKKYDLFIALQVWEHLYEDPIKVKGGRQKEAFEEVMRISKMAVLSFPLNWYKPGNCHHGITEEKIAEWTLYTEPIKKVKVKNRIIYFFKF